MLRGLGFIFGCPLRSCPARTQTSHCLPAESPPCCCDACPVEAGSAVLLWSLPRPEAESLCCSRLPRQRQAASSVGVYLSRDGLPQQRLRQQWACISVGAGCLGNGGRPSPSEHLRPSAQGLFEIVVLLVHWANPNALSWQSPGLAHCLSLAKSQVQPSHVSGCRFNGAPGQVRPVGSAG